MQDRKNVNITHEKTMRKRKEIRANNRKEKLFAHQSRLEESLEKNMARTCAVLNSCQNQSGEFSEH